MNINDVIAVETLLAEGNHTAAAEKIDYALAARANNTMALLLQSELELAKERNGRAREFVEYALKAPLDSPRTAIKLLTVLTKLSESGLIREICAQIPAHVWDSALSLAQVAHLLISVGDYDSAMKFAQAAVDRDRKHPQGLYALAMLKTFFGQLDDAAELCREVLQEVPEDPGSWWLMSRLRQPNASARIDRLRDLTSRINSSDSLVWLHYALHNELHDCGDFEPAWQALSKACEIKRSALSESRLNQLQLFESLRTKFDWHHRTNESSYSHAVQPIFVIGLHRSGTTLADQILAGHSEIASGGETYDIRAQLRRTSRLHYGAELDLRIIERRNEFDYAAIGKNFCRGIAWRARGCKYVTDKLPSNYLNVGFIARALPSSKFICLSRDPIDVGFSSLRTLFSHAAPYSYDSADFVEHHRQYEALMQHWRECLPGRILEVKYDDLVRQPEQTAREMAGFLGIDFQPNMLALESRTTPVATASSVMVRDGIRTDRGRVWQPYAQHLTPLLQAFG